MFLFSEELNYSFREGEAGYFISGKVTEEASCFNSYRKDILARPVMTGNPDLIYLLFNVITWLSDFVKTDTK